MSADQAGRILARLVEIEAEIAALYREMDQIDAALGEHERPHVGYACDAGAALGELEAG